jgi:hypothetical protein
MSEALKKLLAPKVKHPVTWIKIDRRVVYHRLVIASCFKCGSEEAPIVWLSCRSGGVRCLGCRDDGE